MAMEPLNLIKNNYHIMTGAWIVKHPLSEGSPIRGKSSSQMRQENCSIIATITGIDGTVIPPLITELKSRVS
jgi:hypothetical protein